jgi:hypothetical protein
MGMVLRRSTTLCTCPSECSKAVRSIVSFIALIFFPDLFPSSFHDATDETAGAALGPKIGPKADQTGRSSTRHDLLEAPGSGAKSRAERPNRPGLISKCWIIATKASGNREKRPESERIGG